MIISNDFAKVLTQVSPEHIAMCDRRVKSDPGITKTARTVWQMAKRGDPPERIATELKLHTVTVKAFFRDLSVRAGLLHKPQADVWFQTSTSRVTSAIGPSIVQQRERAARFAIVGK